LRKPYLILARQTGAGGRWIAMKNRLKPLEKLEAAAARLRSHADPATASLFIVNPFAGAGGVLSLFSTHPPIAERVRRLRAMALGHAHG
jgi:Zn-dependent protease with chaperone function